MPCASSTGTRVEVEARQRAEVGKAAEVAWTRVTATGLKAARGYLITPFLPDWPAPGGPEMSRCLDVEQIAGEGQVVQGEADVACGLLPLVDRAVVEAGHLGVQPRPGGVPEGPEQRGVQ